jgi:hypothetical protein
MIFCINLCRIFFIKFRAPCKLHLNLLRPNWCELAPTDGDSLFGGLHFIYFFKILLCYYLNWQQKVCKARRTWQYSGNNCGWDISCLCFHEQQHHVSAMHMRYKRLTRILASSCSVRQKSRWRDAFAFFPFCFIMSVSPKSSMILGYVALYYAIINSHYN